MKKFCSKISKPQWRLTIPTVDSPSLFRRSPTRDDNKDHLGVSKKLSKSASGSYDLHQAQKEFDKSNNYAGSVVIEPELSDSESEENYEDARTNSDKMSSADEPDSSAYVDAMSITPQNQETSKNLSSSNSQFHYDVPKISFSFFEESEKNILKNGVQEEEEEPPDYETVTVQSISTKSEVNNDQPSENSNQHFNADNVPLYSNSDTAGDEKSASKLKQEANIEDLYCQVKFRNKHRSELKITLATESKPNVMSKSEISLEKSSSPSTVVENKFIDLYLTKSLEDFTCLSPIKSGSDPNISHSLKDIPEEDEENIYKVPVSNKRYHRLSQSLTDFNVEDIADVQIRTAESEDIEHISCSQVLAEKPSDDVSSVNTQNLEYCKVRSKLPVRIRRATLLRRPKNKAAVTWSNLRAKINNMVAEHAARQKVAAFSSNDSEGMGITIEDMYKSSKDKCKRMLKNTGKMFNTKMKRERENGDGTASDSSSQIIKNDAFFARMRLKPSDIEYKLDINASTGVDCENGVEKVTCDHMNGFGVQTTQINIKFEDNEKEKLDLGSLKVPFKWNRSVIETQSGFEDLRKYVKQGSDFCKELSTILQERSEAELQYSKALAKLSAKLSRACRDNVGAINDAWRAVACELEARAEAHRVLGGALAEDAARPLRNLTEAQHKSRKQAETSVDKSARSLADWRAAEAKGKKHSHACARDNEKLQDQMLDVRLSRTTSLIQLAHMHSQKSASEKETAKLEGKKRKAEDAVKKADIEYYTLCVRAERARLEWESAVLKGSNTFQSLEDERLNNLKTILTAYLHHSSELGPRLIEATERLKNPVSQSDPSKDLTLFVNLRNSSQQISEQLLPDFYCEHITLAMNRERRKQALIKLLHLIRQDIDRERKSKNGLENLSRAMRQTPNFGAEDSQQNVSEKLYHMKSMLTYLEGARYKVQSALLELDNRPKAGHPLAPHITITRDKSGLQHSVLKVPQWLREEWMETDRSPLSEKSEKSEYYNDAELLEAEPDWTDRGAADGNSNQPDSDFDEFSSQTSSTGGISNCDDGGPVQPIAQCRALYAYTPNLPDELTLHPGDVLSVYRKQDDGWWLGECNGNVGIFPATYVENIAAPS